MAKIGRPRKKLDEQQALYQVFDGYQRLKELGWNDAMYCPKDGSTFLMCCPSSTGIHRGHYSGEWPTGSWWAHDAGDLWPYTPMLWKPETQENSND